MLTIRGIMLRVWTTMAFDVVLLKALVRLMFVLVSLCIMTGPRTSGLSARIRVSLFVRGVVVSVTLSVCRMLQ